MVCLKGIISLCWSNDTRPKKQQLITNKFSICFSFSLFSYAFVIQLHQVSFNRIPQLRVAEPAEEAEEGFGWIIQFRIVYLVSCLDLLPTNNDQPTTILKFNAIFGIALHNSSRVSFECSIAFLPRAVI